MTLLSASLSAATAYWTSDNRVLQIVNPTKDIDDKRFYRHDHHRLRVVCAFILDGGHAFLKSLVQVKGQFSIWIIDGVVKGNAGMITV